MNHPNEEILALAAGGDLPLWSGWQVRRHLRSCAECRETRDAYANLRVSLSALPAPEAPANLAATILAAPRYREPAPTRFAPFGAWAAATALAAAGVLFVTMLPLRPSPSIGLSKAIPPQIQTSPLPPAPETTTPAATKSAVASPAPVARFTTVAAAEWARDRRYLSGFAPSPANPNAPRTNPALDRWADGARAQDRHLPRPVVGLQAEMLRSHALPARVEVVALPESPLQIVSAEALFAEGHLIDPVVEVRNVSSHVIREYQVAWVFRDASGAEFRGRIMSCCTQAGATAKALAPGATAKLSETIVLEAEKKKTPESALTTARVFVRSATTANEGVWVPARAALEAHRLGEFLPLPAETARLLDEYRRSGVQALARLKYQGEEAR